MDNCKPTCTEVSIVSNRMAHVEEKINSVNDRLDTHISKVEDKLDSLIELMNIVTKLQERDSHTTREIIEIKSDARLFQTSNADSINRLHARIDTLAITVTENRTEMDKYRNIVTGFSIASGLILILAQSFGAYYLSQLTNGIEDNKIALTKQVKRVDDLENNTNQLWSTINNKSGPTPGPIAPPR